MTQNKKFQKAFLQQSIEALVKLIKFNVPLRGFTALPQRIVFAD